MINLEIIKNWRWEDICNAVYEKTGLDVALSIPFLSPESKLERYLNACYKINIISEFLNDGVVFDFNNRNQGKYYPYFRKEASGWVVHSYSDNGIAVVGFGFYYKDSKTALFAANTFFDIYLDYLPE